MHTADRRILFWRLMQELVLETPEGLALRHELAGAGSRAAAGIIDLILFAMLFLAALILVLVFSTLDDSILSGVLGAMLAGGTVLLLITWLTLVPTGWDGRTPGKRLMGLRVVDRRGWPASLRQHFLRALLWPLEVVLMVPIPAGLILMSVLPNCQRLGDLVAGTVCLREKGARHRLGSSLPEPFQGQTRESLPDQHLSLSSAQRELFSGHDQTLLRELFVRSEIDSSERRLLFLRAWVHYAGVLGMRDTNNADKLNADQAAERLRELYLFLRG